MWLSALGPGSARAADLQVSEAVRGTPDILSEARWGLIWLMKMQRPDGSVYHKVDSAPDFAAGKRPEEDTNKFYAEGTSTVDAADFTAVMAQASRVFQPFDVDFARQCGAAADKSWQWVKANPNIGVTDTTYPDPDPSQEVFWAQAEMACRLKADTTGEEDGLLQTIRKKMTAGPPDPMSTSNPAPFGWLALADENALPRDIRTQAGQGLQALGDSLQKKALDSGYGVVLGPKEYEWGSCQQVLFDAATLLFAAHATDQKSYRDCALEQLHYVLGRNSLNRSFVTGHGANPIVAPFHWTMLDFHLYMPGWAAGGPNSDPKGADPQTNRVIKLGAPPAKCFVDACESDGSWASNQGTITEEGALVFVSGMLLPRDIPKAAGISPL
jgi:endoglucanase